MDIPAGAGCEVSRERRTRDRPSGEPLDTATVPVVADPPPVDDSTCPPVPAASTVVPQLAVVRHGLVWPPPEQQSPWPPRDPGPHAESDGWLWVPSPTSPRARRTGRNTDTDTDTGSEQPSGQRTPTVSSPTSPPASTASMSITGPATPGPQPCTPGGLLDRAPHTTRTPTPGPPPLYRSDPNADRAGDGYAAAPHITPATTHKAQLPTYPASHDGNIAPPGSTAVFRAAASPPKLATPSSAMRPAETINAPPSESRPTKTTQATHATQPTNATQLDAQSTFTPRRGMWWRRRRPTTTATVPVIDAAVLSRVRRPLAPALTPYTVATVSLKGGVGKTTVSACVGLTLARYRPDRVIAVDANLHAGTLADRLVPGEPRATVQHLLDDLLDPAVSINAVSDIDRYVHLADRLTVLAGHHDPSVGAAFAGDDYAELISALGRFYHLIVADCGTSLADGAMRALLDHANTLLLVATPGDDAVILAKKTLHWLTHHGYPHLVDNCIAVMCHPSGSAPFTPHTVQSWIASSCPTVIDIPADPRLAQGAVLRLDELTVDVRAAYMSLAAAVIDASAASSTTGQHAWPRSRSRSPGASEGHSGR